MKKLSSLFRLAALAGMLCALCAPSATAQHLPGFDDVSGTTLTPTNGQWVTVNPAQPNNIDLVETRIFKMPKKGSGIKSIEFRLVGADGGTARFQWGLNDKFSKGGGGGQVQFSLDLEGTNTYDRPFLVTFGKKGESKTIDRAFYCSAGGGGSTGMTWAVPGARSIELSDAHFIAGAGGGSGGFSFVFGILNGNSATGNATTVSGYYVVNNYQPQFYNDMYGNELLWLVSGGSSLMRDQVPQSCCTNVLKQRAAMSTPYSVLEYQLGYDLSTSGQSLMSVTHGQKGGKPTTIFISEDGTTNITGFGVSASYTLVQLGGKGGAGYGGGGAGSSTTTITEASTNASGIPTGGAGGTGALNRSSVPEVYPNTGEGGWNNYNDHLISNISVSARAITDNPQSGYFMYRTIMDTEPPQIRFDNATVSLKDYTGGFSYDATVSLAEALQPYIMQPDGIWDNDGIASVSGTVNGHPLTHFECFMARPGAGPVPVELTVTDGAGNTAQRLVMIQVTDPVKPFFWGLSEVSPNPLDPDLPWRIDVSNGPVKLTAANFPKAWDGCNGSDYVTTHFPPTTFYCNDAGDRPVQYYYEDYDGNTSPVYTKTFKVRCNTPTPDNLRYLYVDQAATGANDGSSWANAFKSLQDALSVGRTTAIYVAQGTYRPTTGNDRDARFELGDNLKIYGGFPTGGAGFADRNPEAYPTVLSGEIGNPAVGTDNSYHVVVISGNNTHLEGFTIRDGYSQYDMGPGLWIDQSETELTTDHNTVIRNCKFLNNMTTLGDGGGIYADYKNTANYNRLSVRNCWFEKNKARLGGAVCLGGLTSPPNMKHELINCVFSDNTAVLFGGGINVSQNAGADVVNCTFVDNKSAADGGGAVMNRGTVRLRNSILYFNLGDGVSSEIDNEGTAQVDYCNIQGSGGSSNWSLTGIQNLGHNIDADPLFAGSPEWGILKESPCVNAGMNTYNTEPYDFYGNRRIIMNTIDMGVFEAENFVIFVAADAPGGGDGASWGTAFNNLHDGIAAAGTGVNTKDVWVKAGTYRPDRRPGYNTATPGNRDNSFYINQPIDIYGGFAGTETGTMERNTGQNPTILSGDIGTPNNASDNTYHVLTLMTNGVRLDGLIVEGGNADDFQDVNKQIGGGVFQYNGIDNVVSNCVFRNNHATDRGGAWYANAHNTGHTDFVQSVFYGNTASRSAALFMRTSHEHNSSGEVNFYNITAFNNISSTAGAGAFEAAQENSSNPAKLNFYNSLLAGNAPENYNDAGNPGNILLDHTYTSASGEGVFANVSGIAGADGKIMTADDGIRLNVSSPAISFGDEALLYSSVNKDIAGNPRIVNKVDAGAYESPHNAPLIADGNKVIYVKPVATGEGTGQDWDNATGDLHNAIHAFNAEKVFVAVGTYKVGAHSFIMKNGVEIYGGFDPVNSITDLSHSRIMPDPANNAIKGTVLDGQQTRPVIWNVFTEGTAMNSSAVLDGFMLMYGKHPTGGGVRNIHASPTLRNVVINQNRATLMGAGMYNDHSSPKLTNVIICNNGIDALFEPNGGQNIYGGGMYNTGSSVPVLTNVTLAGNYLRTPDESTVMTGAGIYNDNSSPIIKNSILWSNRNGFNITMPGSDIANENGGTVTIQHSITQEYNTGNPADHNLVNINPEFEDIGARNFRLLAVSPAIDAGSNALYSGLNGDTKDLAGKSRVYDFANNKPVDLGAYEFQCLPVDYSGMTFASKTVTYDGSPHSIEVQNLPQQVSVTYEMRDPDWEIVEELTATNAGIYTITATMLPIGSAGDCEPYVRTATLTIQKAPSIITADEIQEFVYDGTVKNVTASLNHTDVILTYSPELGYTAAGVYQVTVSVPATANYTAATENITLAIENADFTGITLQDAVIEFDATPKSLAITGTLPEGAIVAYTGNGKTRPGTYTVSAMVRKESYNDLWLTATMTIEGVTVVPDVNKIVYVKQTGSGTKDGSSWENATADLQGAIDAEGAEQVLVASGNYDIPTPHSFIMKEGVKIYGGFNPVNNTTDWATRTLPDEGTDEGSVLNGKNESPLIWNHDNGLTNTSLLDSFTLMNGEGALAGAIYNYNVSPAFSNLVIRNNKATIGGGGMYNNAAPVTLNNSIIKDNTAQYGGGIRNNNSASRLTNVIITGNSATMATEGAGGGGIFNQASALELTNVLIADNSTNFQGGGFRNLSGNPVLTNVTIASNTTVNNAATTAMDIAGGTPQLNNSIVFGTVGGSYIPQSSLIEDNTSNARTGASAHILTDIFTDPEGGDYTLKTGSPAINAGSNDLFPGLDANTRDLAGNPRLIGSSIDMGAYENPDGALPVRWISFEGRLSDQRQAVLTWKTEETNVSHYEVERSINAKDFHIVGTVIAGSTGSGNYSLTDPAPVSGTVYYRIRQVDLDGSFSHSRMISLNYTGRSKLFAYPNPAKDNVIIGLGTEYIGSKVKLVSTAGIVLQQAEVKEEVLILDISRYAPGVYLLQMHDGKVVKLVKE